MVFTIQEIKQYLKCQTTLEKAIENLSEDAIIQTIEDEGSLNFEKSKENLEKYEMKIGLYKLKEEQRAIYRNSNGNKGKYWMALSPKWIEKEEFKKRLNTSFDIAYWVNYGDGDTYGWFSVEEIKQWLTTPDLRLSDLGGTKEK